MCSGAWNMRWKSKNISTSFKSKFKFEIMCAIICNTMVQCLIIKMNLPCNDTNGLKGRHTARDDLTSALFVICRERSRMEEEARKLHEEGIRKKLISPGKGELSSFPNGTKVQITIP